jgi:hypothetical protein
MATKIYKDGNYLIIDNGVDDVTEVVASQVVADKGADLLWRFRVNGNLLTAEGLDEADIQDANGVVYSDFTEWIRHATGETASNTGEGVGNTTFTPLASGATFTGIWEDVSAFNALTIACLSSTSGTLTAQFSADGITVHSSLNYTVTANTNEVHRLTVTRKYFRLVFVNSATPQTTFHIQTIYGSQNALSSPINTVLQSDSDATTVRALDFNLLLAEGLYQNRVATIKDGFNSAISMGTVPEDITNEGATYAGFPTGSPEAGQIVVAGADTGTVFYAYLASPNDIDYTFGSKAITGAGTYALGHNIWRCNFAYFISSSPTATNVNTITIQNTPTTANVFCVIPTGYGQTYCSAYTVPASSAVYIDRITGSLRGSTSGSLDGAFWYRDSVNGGFRLRFPFELQYGGLYFDDIDYLIRIPAGVDFIPRVTAASTNSLQAKISYRIVKVKE